MRIHRLANARFADMEGIGGENHSGRWHTRGSRIVYFASSCALALNEVLVNLDLPPELLPDYVHMIVQVPEAVWHARRVISETALHDDWRTADHSHETRSIGDGWLAVASSALLDVPSAVIPSESNVLLNPAHADTESCEIVSVIPFIFDPRLFEFG